MTTIPIQSRKIPPSVTWERLPADFELPDEPVESNLQLLLAAALRESLELASLILESGIIATNFGICATVDRQTVVKAPDWVYIPAAQPFPAGEARRSYTPRTEGDLPSIVMEFISATDGGEYSFNPHYPYGKWYFYEQILKVPHYVIFHPQLQVLEVYHLVDDKYQLASPDADRRFWIESLGLFLGTWSGKKSEYEGCWLRWWDKSGHLLLWGSELLALERQQVDRERQRAEQESQRADRSEEKSVRLAAQLRSMGIDPDQI
ncbi:Uma2 family endonuclease [Chamaesiphon sp.]|uniref:Uma2 family endonuclease n=1 Tax=Chamaesiphon sp. TaxID=2814140 RepID=UPI003592F4B6